MPPTHSSPSPRPDQQRKAELDRYEARTAIEMEERRTALLLNATERRAFLAITMASAALAMALALVGALHHDSLWYPGGSLGLTVICGGGAVKLHFLRGGERPS